MQVDCAYYLETLDRINLISPEEKNWHQERLANLLKYVWPSQTRSLAPLCHLSS